jgi:hypothetical protein
MHKTTNTYTVYSGEIIENLKFFGISHISPTYSMEKIELYKPEILYRQVIAFCKAEILDCFVVFTLPSANIVMWLPPLPLS